jgi:hypothetical protein
MTGGLVQALRVLLPAADVKAFPIDDPNVDVLNRYLKNADAWLVSSRDLMTSGEVEQSDELRVIPFPTLFFDAFHPDQVYAWLADKSLVQSATGPYNSAIALWAWRQGWTVSDTIKLFTPEIFESLGYHNRWQTAVKNLEQDFSVFPNLNFHDFFDSLIRSGVFMHTVNHPGIAAIAQLARVLAKQVNPSTNYSEIPIEPMLVDGLLMTSFAWSVYPSIANSLGFTGCFLWKLADHSVIGLEEFISRSFAMYEVQKPIDIQCQQLERPIYDELLLPLRRIQTP